MFSVLRESRHRVVLLYCALSLGCLMSSTGWRWLW